MSRLSKISIFCHIFEGYWLQKKGKNVPYQKKMHIEYWDFSDSCKIISSLAN